MTMPKQVPHSFLRCGADNTCMFFMAVDPHFIGQDVDIDLTDDGRLQITPESGESLITAVLTAQIHQHLANRTTRVILADWEGNPVSTFELPPLRPSRIGGGAADGLR